MEEKKNKKKKVLIPLIIGGVGVLAAVAIVLAVLAGRKPVEQTEENLPDKLYWNVDRLKYVGVNGDGSTSREVNVNDAHYHILFATEEGRTMDRRIENKELTEKLDQFDLVGLVFDEKNVITGYRDINEFTGGIAVNRLYFMEKDGNEYKFNAAASLDGKEFTYTIPDTAKFYDVSGAGGRDYGTIISGDELLENDVVTAVQNKDGEITHVYLAYREVIGDIYWNVERKWDSVNKVTTREPNLAGEYEFLLAVNGEQLVIKTRDYKTANQMDSFNARCFGLELDEMGYVSKVLQPRQVTGGGSFGSWFVVTDITDGNVTVFQASDGQTITAPMSPRCKVFNVSGLHTDPNGFDGEYDTLQVGDKQHGLLNSKGQIVVCFVVGNRTAETEVYWNVKRQYDGTTLSTTRVPNAEGKYVFEVYVNGKQRFLWTKDKEIATLIDKQGMQAFGGVLEGDEIVKFYTPAQCTGGSPYAAWDVTSVGSKITILKDPYGTSSDAGQTRELTLAKDCKIYDMSADANPMANSNVKLQVNDRINYMLNKQNEVAYLYITKHLYDAEVFFNVTRKWDSANKQTSRKLEADGTYHIDLLVNGQVKTYRTADKALATQIDSLGTRVFGLFTNGDMITKYFPVASVAKTKGGTNGSMYNIESISGKTLHLKEKSTGKTTDVTLADNCKVYNVGLVDKYVGEITTPKVGDKVQPALNGEKKAAYLYIVERLHTHVCEDCGKTVDFSTLTGSINKPGTYHYCLGSDTEFANQISIGGTGAGQTDVHVTLDLNGHTLKTASGKRAIAVIGDNCSLTIVDCKGTGRIEGGGDIVTTSNTSTAPVIYVMKGSLKIYKAVIDGSKLTNAATRTDTNGNEVRCTNSTIYVASGTEFTMLGGEIIGSHSNVYLGGALYVSGTANLSNVKVSGGQAEKAGGNVYLGAKGTLNLKENIDINGGTLYDGTPENFYISNGGTLVLDNSLKGKIGLTTGREGVFSNTGVAAVKDVFVSDQEGGVITANTDGALEIHFELSKVAFEKDTYEVPAAESANLSAIVTPASMAGKVTLTYESSDPESLTVDQNGVVVGLKETGDKTVTVTVTAVDNANPANKKTATCEVKVTPETPGGHTHDLNGHGSRVRYTEWTGTDTLPTEAGFYYLASDVNLKSQWTPAANEPVTICLNGKTIKAAEGKRAIGTSVAQSSFSICDCSDGMTGKITGNGEYSSHGAVINLAYGEANIYGGTIEGGTATGTDVDGGNVWVANGTVMNIYNTTIKNGSATRNGGNIYTAGTLNLYDVTIENGTGLRGADIMVSGDYASLSLNGTVLVGDIFLNKSLISVKNYEGTGDIAKKAKITLVTTKGVFTKDAAPAGVEDFFEAAAKGYIVNRLDDDTLEISLAPVVSGHEHCVCGENVDSIKNLDAAKAVHTCDTKVTYTAVGTYNALLDAFAAGGSYYLTADIAMHNTGRFLLPEGKTVNLCLNGFSITTDGKINAFYLGSDNSVLNLSDCSKDKTSTISTTVSTPTARLVTVAKTAVFNMFGGTIEKGGSSTEAGGNIRMSDSAVMNLFGGSIKDGKVTASGTFTANDAGNIYSGGKSVFNMYGGTISGGSGRNGGNLWSNNVANIYGGEILDGVFSGNGGNIFISNPGTLRIAGGTIRGGNKAGVKTGATANVMIYGDNSCCYISGGTIDGCISANKFKTMTITGDTVIADATGKYGLTIAGGKTDAAAIKIGKEDGTYQALGEKAHIIVMPTASNAGKVIFLNGKEADLGKMGTNGTGTLVMGTNGIAYKN